MPPRPEVPTPDASTSTDTTTPERTLATLTVPHSAHHANTSPSDRDETTNREQGRDHRTTTSSM